MTRASRDKVFCNQCKNTTNHSVKALYRYNEYVYFENAGELESESLGVSEAQVLECEGCETVSFRHLHHPNNPTIWSFDAENGGLVSSTGPFTYTKFYPERLEGWITEKPVSGLPTNIRKAYKEVIECYNSDLLLMCASGLRCIVESLCAHFSIASEDASGKAVSLGSRIRQLGIKRLIPEDLASALQEHKELGNVALHYLVVPEKEALKLAIELVEITFENLFNVSTRHVELKGKMIRRIS